MSRKPQKKKKNQSKKNPVSQKIQQKKRAASLPRSRHVLNFDGLVIMVILAIETLLARSLTRGQALLSSLIRRLGGPFPTSLFPENFEVLWSFFEKGERRKVAIALVCAVLCIPFEFCGSYFFKEVIDHSKIWDLGWVLASVTVFVILYACLVCLLKNVVLNATKRVRLHIDVRRANALEDDIHPLNVEDALPTDIEHLKNALIEGTARLFICIVNIAGYLVIMAAQVGGIVTLLTIAACVVMSIAVRSLLYRPLLRALTRHRDVSSIVDRAYRLICTPESGADFMVNNTRLPDGRMSRLQAVYELLDEDTVAQQQIARLDALIQASIHWGSMAILVGALVLMWVWEPASFSPGASMVVSVVLERFAKTLNQLIECGARLQWGHVAMRRSIHKLLDLPQAEPAPEEFLVEPGAALTASGLSDERDGEILYKDVKFRASRGRVIAFQGPRGSAKTPTLEGFAGLNQPSAGRILFGSTEIMNRSVRRRLVYLVLDQLFVIWQVDTLFLLCKAVKPDVSSEEIWEALERVGLKERVAALPDGLNGKLVNPRTGRYMLSRGERYLVNIARAWLRDTPIVALDEPLRGRGPQERRRIWKAIQALVSAGKIVLLSIETENDLEGLNRSNVVVVRMARGDGKDAGGMI